MNTTNTRKNYPSDLKESEQNLIKDLFPTKKHNAGRKKVHSIREIFNAILYLLKSGCSWRMLPHDFPPCKTVYHYFNLWSEEGLFEEINTKLRINFMG